MKSDSNSPFFWAILFRIVNFLVGLLFEKILGHGLRTTRQVTRYVNEESGSAFFSTFGKTSLVIGCMNLSPAIVENHAT